MISAKKILVASAIALASTTAFAANADLVKKGEEIFNKNTKGNCLACHNVSGKKIDGPGSMGPKLQYLSAWPDEALYEKIYNPYTTNPNSTMPAYGINGWLDDSEIKAVVAYLKTIN